MEAYNAWFSTVNSIRSLPNIFNLLFTYQTKLTFIIAFTIFIMSKKVKTDPSQEGRDVTI